MTRWMLVTDDFDWTPAEKPRSLVAYKKGYRGPAKAAAIELGVSLGRAEEVPNPGARIRHGEDRQALAQSAGRGEGEP